jgi:hypothetical protein
MISQIFLALENYSYVGDNTSFTTEPKPVVHSRYMKSGLGA